jgi:glycosidase
MPTPPSDTDTAFQAQRTLGRLMPRLLAANEAWAAAHPEAWAAFCLRLQTNFADLFALLVHIYAGQYDFFYHLETLLASMARSWQERPADLKALDEAREADPDWFQRNTMLGAVGYVDLFSGNLQGVRERIPYLQELGITYLHLMPLFRSPEGENDGGYAISSYREVDPRLGSMQELGQLAGELRRSGISLVLDFVFNHTSNEHEWARRAAAGDPEYQAYYHMYPDRGMPDAYEASLREIFPDEHPGAFTYQPEIRRWVWTTFHHYQWDLNYRNPEVFIRMTEELLFLANMGVEVLRLDAVAFLWKQMGTACENLPEAHQLIRAFRAAARIAAPSLLFKSEAIVHPDEVARYIRRDECELSYNPLLMALLWEALATRDTRLMNASLRERLRIPPGTAWVNYVRCHDDIGWTFSDDDAASVGINGYAHRQFLNSFYTGRFPGSFARGLPFQENPKTGDCRISGTAASLAGLEKALHEETEQEVDLAIRRLLLIHGLTFTTGGIPLIYLGDEIGTRNDYDYRKDPAKARDSRWVHRPFASAERYARRGDPATVEGRIYAGMQRLAALRKSTPALGGQEFQWIDTGDGRVFGFVRGSGAQRLVVLANFSEQECRLPGNLLRLYGLGYDFVDLLAKEPVSGAEIGLGAYQLRVMAERESPPG